MVKQIFLTWFDLYSSAHALVDGWNYTGSCFLGGFLFLMLLKTMELSLLRILEYWNTCSEYWITRILAQNTAILDGRRLSSMLRRMLGGERRKGEHCGMIDVHGRAQTIMEDKNKKMHLLWRWQDFTFYFEDDKILSLVVGIVDRSLLWKQCTMINDHVLVQAIMEDIFFCPRGKQESYYWVAYRSDHSTSKRIDDAQHWRVTMKVVKKERLMFKFSSKPSWKISEVLSTLLWLKGKAVSCKDSKKKVNISCCWESDWRLDSKENWITKNKVIWKKQVWLSFRHQTCTSCIWLRRNSINCMYV